MLKFGRLRLDIKEHMQPYEVENQVIMPVIVVAVFVVVFYNALLPHSFFSPHLATNLQL